PALIKLGLKATMGKGARSQPVKDAFRQHKGVYFGAIGGGGGGVSRLVERGGGGGHRGLGEGARRRLGGGGVPALLGHDRHGGDLYQDGIKAYAREET